MYSVYYNAGYRILHRYAEIEKNPLCKRGASAAECLRGVVEQPLISMALHKGGA
jgi:hypothetical protein